MQVKPTDEDDGVSDQEHRGKKGSATLQST